MTNFRQTIKMMAAALAMGIALCSCNAAGGSESYETTKANVAPGAAAPAAKTADTEVRAQAVLFGTELTFYYDNKDHSTQGTVYEVSSNGYGVKGSPWKYSGFTSAKFDKSCQDWNPTSMVFFFAGCAKAETIDLTNLNTASVADLSCMFQKCTALKSLDLTGLDTGKVIEM